jgi:hypothetical protein
MTMTRVITQQSLENREHVR